MKIRSLFLAAILVVFSSSSFAKSHSKAHHKNISEVVMQDTAAEDQKAYKDSLEVGKIEADLQKIFAEAEVYFKASKAWKAIKCTPKSGFICTKRECAKRDIKSYVVLNKKAATIKRCDSEYCEEFPAVYNQTGIYFNVQSDGPVGTLIRVLGDSRYKEVSAIGLDAYIANGECVVISEEEAAAIGHEEEKKK